jgi:SET domain-containing protein
MEFKIDDSTIHGKGLFSLQPILKNQKLFDYSGVEMTWKEFKETYGDYKTNSLNTYPMRRLWKIIVAKEEPYKSSNLTNYVNESDNPNVILKKRALYALRNIDANEELTLKYPNGYTPHQL